MRVYLCDPHSPWQRGTNENTNGLLRQYFPKGTDLSMHSANEIAAAAAALNSRPRRRLKDTGRGALPVSPISRQRSCCDDRLNPPVIGKPIARPPTPSASLSGATG